MTAKKWLLWSFWMVLQYNALAQAGYTVRYQWQPPGKPALVKIETKFADSTKAYQYLQQLPTILLNLGYVGAAIDTVQYSPSQCTALVYAGNKYNWSQITVSDTAAFWLQQAGLTQAGLLKTERHFLGLVGWFVIGFSA